MNVLYDILPKDIVYIIEDYSKDRTNYNEVIKQLQDIIQETIEKNNEFEEWCYGCGNVGCEDFSFKQMIVNRPECFLLHFICMDNMIEQNEFTSLVLRQIFDPPEQW